MVHKCPSIPRVCRKDRACIPGREVSQPASHPRAPAQTNIARDSEGGGVPYPDTSGLLCSFGKVWNKTQVSEHRLDSWGRRKQRNTALCSLLAVSVFLQEFAHFKVASGKREKCLSRARSCSTSGGWASTGERLERQTG